MAIVKIVILSKIFLPNLNISPISKVNWSAPQNGTLLRMAHFDMFLFGVRMKSKKILKLMIRSYTRDVFGYIFRTQIVTSTCRFY